MALGVRGTSVANLLSSPLPPHRRHQGFDVSQTARGVRVLLDFAAEVERALQEAQAPAPRVAVIDIGGGLSANYGSDEARPSHAELCAALREVRALNKDVPGRLGLPFSNMDAILPFSMTQAAPELWSDPSRRVITEYGRSLTAKAGWAVSRVEYAFDNQPPTNGEEGGGDGPGSLPESFLRTAILHVGADALLRECYCPAKFPHRMGVFECVAVDGSIGVARRDPRR